MNKILVIEDKLAMRELICEYFSEQSFDVTAVGDGILGLASFKQNQPDIILLDLMMPRMDGFEFLKRYRKNQQTPVIVITAKEDESDAIKALELGADDYVNKPVRLKELHARIQAVLRRHNPVVKQTLTHANLILDLEALNVTVNEVEIKLTPTEIQLLKVFLENKTRVLTKEYLINTLADNGLNAVESSLKVHINNLRKKIHSDGDIIETVFGTGYKLKAV